MTNTTETKKLKLGTRGSPLAMAQAFEVRDRLQATHVGLEVEVIEIKVLGDQILDRPLSEVGGKGLFVKELDDAQLDGRIDIGVHSMKDLETSMPDGIAIRAVLPREDVRDAFISKKYKSLEDMPAGSVVGTSSLRRQAIILNKRPDLEVVTFRGNVQTRLKKLEDGVADATLLAVAGLNRLGYEHEITEALDPDFMLPAAAQGAIAITCRDDDAATSEILAALNDAESECRVSAERAMLADLDGSCRTPIAGMATVDGTKLVLQGFVARPDGKACVSATESGNVIDAVAIGKRVGAVLRKEMGENFFD